MVVPKRLARKATALKLLAAMNLLPEFTWELYRESIALSAEEETALLWRPPRLHTTTVSVLYGTRTSTGTGIHRDNPYE